MVFKWIKDIFVGDSGDEPTNKAGTQRFNINIAAFSRGDYVVDVVGESHYMNALKRAKESAEKDGDKSVVTTVLVREPDNKFDKNAIQVCAVVNEEMDLIGYLSRKRAMDYREVVDLWQRKGYFVSCKAALFGGEGRKVNIGVWLDLPDPDEIEEDYSHQFPD